MRDKRAHVLEDWPDLVGLNADFLLVGNSRTSQHAIPERIERFGLEGYNIAYDGYTASMGTNRLSFALEHAATKPRYVLVQLDLSFAPPDCNQTVFPMKDGMLRYFFLDQININSYFQEYSNWREADAFIPLLRYKGYPLMFFKHILGWNRWDKRKEKGYWDIPENENKFVLPRVEKSDSTQLNLCGIDSICTANNIQLIGIVPPSFSSVYSPSIAAIARSPLEIVWDLSDLFKNSEPKYFRDKAHLNTEGARIYSDTISNRLNELILYGPS
jgi:hypothetical protein